MKLEEIIKNQDIDALQKIIDEGINISNIRLLAILDLVKEPNLEFLQLLIENGVNINSEGSKKDTEYMFFLIEESLKENKKLWSEAQGDNEDWLNVFIKHIRKTIKNHQYNLNFNNGYMSNSIILDVIFIRINEEIQEGRLSLKELKKKYLENEEIREARLSLEELKKKYLEQGIYYNYSTLMFAIDTNNVELVKFLIQNGADINLYDYNKGNTALHYAIKRKNFNIIKLLIQNGADINKTNFERIRPLAWAIEKSLDVNIIAFLIENGALLYEYSDLKSSLSITKRFRGVYTQSDFEKDEFGNLSDDKATILMRAIKSKNNKLVEVLIKHSVPLDIQNEFGDTALIIASSKEYYYISKLLIDAGASISIENFEGINAIDVTDDKIKKMLLNKTTYRNRPKDKRIREKTKKRYNNFIPLNLSPTDMLEYLFSDYRDSEHIDNQDKDGKTKLMLSCEKGDDTAVSQLIKFGANIDIKDYQGYIALDYASFSDNFENIKNILINIDEKHQPSKLVTILTKFSSNKKLKYSNHTWDSSLNYNDFIKDLKDEFKNIEDDLKILSSSSSTLYHDIYSFLFDENIIGWSSKVIKKEVEKGILPHNISLDTTNQPFKTFSDAIDNFKSLFVVKQNDKKLKLLKKFTKIKKELSLKSIDLNDLKKDKIDKFFTDTKRFEKALTLILKDIQENSNDDKKDIVVEADTISIDDTELIEIKVIHVNSTSSKTAEALKETIDKNGGNFQTIYSNLLSVCDWSIDTICQDGKRYRIDYLYPEINNSKPHCIQIDDESRGFTHILRFYI